MKIHVIQATPRFARAINRIHFQTWLATYPSAEAGITQQDIRMHFQNKKARYVQRRKGLENPSKNSRMYIAKAGNRIIGMCGVEKSQTVNELSAIYVLPEYQGKGVGKLLWQTAFQFFNPELPIVLGVASYNEKTIGFYQTLGFISHIGKYQTHEYYELSNGKRMKILTMIAQNK